MDKDRSQSSLEVLTKARGLISDPLKWTKGANARDRDGRPTHFLSPSADCFCVWGAIQASAAPSRLVANQAIEMLDAQAPAHNVIWFNDNHADHADVLALFDRAIELAAQSQGSAAAGPHSSSPSTGL